MSTHSYREFIKYLGSLKCYEKTIKYFISRLKNPIKIFQIKTKKCNVLKGSVRDSNIIKRPDYGLLVDEKLRMIGDMYSRGDYTILYSKKVKN